MQQITIHVSDSVHEALRRLLQDGMSVPDMDTMLDTFITLGLNLREENIHISVADLRKKLTATSASDAGRRGGSKTSERYGTQHYKDMGAKGGSIGGRKTAERYGADYYTKLGKKSAAARREKKLLRESQGGVDDSK